MADIISEGLAIHPLRHLLNSPGLLRFPDLQLDMVRLGIGLYGVTPLEEKITQLQPVATLKTVVSQVRSIKSGGPLLGMEDVGMRGRISSSLHSLSAMRMDLAGDLVAGWVLSGFRESWHP